MSDQERTDEPSVSASEWMQSLYQEHGKITPRLVLEAARPEDSPGHGYVFNVGIEEAAEGYYLERAHKLIKSVKVTVMTRPQEPPRRVRVYHHVISDEGEKVYEPLEEIVRSVDKFEQVRRAALQRLNEAQTALGDLEIVAQDESRKTVVHRAWTVVKDAHDMVTSA